MIVVYKIGRFCGVYYSFEKKYGSEFSMNLFPVTQ